MLKHVKKSGVELQHEAQQIRAGKSNINLACFVESNVFLELDQERADECEVLLNKVRKGSLRTVTTGFHIDSHIDYYGKLR